MKCVDYCGEHHIKKLQKFCSQNNPQRLKSTLTNRFKYGLMGKDGF